MDDTACSTSNDDFFDQIFGKEEDSHSSSSSTAGDVCSDHEDIYGIQSSTKNAGYEGSYVEANLRYLKENTVEVFHGDRKGTFELIRLKNGIELENKWKRNLHRFTCIDDDTDDSITSIEFSETENYSLYGTYNGHLNLVKTSFETTDKLYDKRHVYTTENNYPVCKVAYNQMDTGLVGCSYVNCDLQQEEVVVVDLARQRNVEKSTVLVKYQTKERIWDVKWGWYDSGQLMISSSNNLRILDLRDKEKCPRTLFLPYSCQLLAPCKFRDSILAVATEKMGRSGVALFDVRKLACPLYEYDVHESAAEAEISTLRWHPRQPYQLFYTSKNSRYIGRLNTETSRQFNTPSVGQLRLDVSKTRHYNLPMETVWNLSDYEEKFLNEVESLRNKNYPLCENPIRLPGYLEQYEKAQADENQELPIILTYPRIPRTSSFHDEETAAEIASSEKPVPKDYEELEKEPFKELEDLEELLKKNAVAPYEEYRKQSEKQAEDGRRSFAQKLEECTNQTDEGKTIKRREPPRPTQYTFRYLYIKENSLILRQRVVDICFGISSAVNEFGKTAFEVREKSESSEENSQREANCRNSFGSWAPQEVLNKLEIDGEIKTALLDIITPYFPEKALISYDTAQTLSETVISLLEQEYMKRGEIKEGYRFAEDDNGFFGFWITENIRAFTIPTAFLDGVVCLTENVDNMLLYVPNTSPKIERLPSSYFQATLAKLRANDYYASTSFEVAEKTYKNLTAWVKPTLSLKHRDLVEVLLHCREKKEDWLLWLNESVAFWERPLNSEFLANVHREYMGIWTELRKKRAAKIKDAYAMINKQKKVATLVPSESEFNVINRGSENRLRKPIKGYNTTGTNRSITKSFAKLLDEEVQNKVDDDDQDDGIRITFGSNGRTPSLGSIATTAGTTPQGSPQDKRDVISQFINMEKRGSLTKTGTPEEKSTTAAGRQTSRPISIGAKKQKSGTYVALRTPPPEYFEVDEDSSFKWLFGSTQSTGKEREITTPSGRSPKNLAEVKACRKISMASKNPSFTSIVNMKPEIPKTLSIKKEVDEKTEPSTSGSLGSHPLSDDDTAKTPVQASCIEDFPDIETPKKEQSFVTPEDSREVSVEPVKEEVIPKQEKKVEVVEKNAWMRETEQDTLVQKTQLIVRKNTWKKYKLPKQYRIEIRQKAEQEKKERGVVKKSRLRNQKDSNIGKEAKPKEELTSMVNVSVGEQETQTEWPKVVQEKKKTKKGKNVKDPPVVKKEPLPIPIPMSGERFHRVIRPNSPAVLLAPVIMQDEEKKNHFEEQAKEKAKTPEKPSTVTETDPIVRESLEAKVETPKKPPTVTAMDILVGESLDSMEGVPRRHPQFTTQISLDLTNKPVVIQGRETNEYVMIVEMAKEAQESPTNLKPSYVVPNAKSGEFIPEDPTIKKAVMIEPKSEFEFKRPADPEPYTDENSIVIQREDPSHFEELDVKVTKKKRKMPKSILKPVSKSAPQTVSKSSSRKNMTSLDENSNNEKDAEYTTRRTRPGKFGYDDMVAFLMGNKEYKKEKLIVSRRKWPTERKELLTLREWDRLRIEARLDREEELERLAELKKKKESELSAKQLALLNRVEQVDACSSYSTIPDTVVESTTVAKKLNVASAEKIPKKNGRRRKLDDDDIEFVNEGKVLTRREVKDLLKRTPPVQHWNIFFAIPLPVNQDYQEQRVDRINFDFEVKGLPGLLQLMETEINEEEPLRQIPWDNSLFQHLQLFTGPYRERMLKTYNLACDDFYSFMSERPRKEAEFYTCMYMALFHGKFNAFLALVEELFLFLFYMKEEARDPDQIPDNPTVTNDFLDKFIELLIDFIDFAEITKHNTDLCPMERYRFESSVEDICGQFADYLDKHVVLMPILMTLKQEVMEDGQPGDLHQLVMNLPNLAMNYKLLFLVRTVQTPTLHSALRKFFKGKKGLDRLPFIGVGRHHDTLAVLAEHLGETNDFQEVAHILLSSRAFEEDDWYHFTLHEILAYQDPDLDRPLFIDPELNTTDIPEELLKLPDRPENFSMYNFENYSMDDPDHPLNRLVKLWKKETPGGAARLFAWLHENGRLPPTHHLGEVYPRYNIPSTLSMELLYDICKRAVLKYFDFLLTLDGKSRDYQMEEVETFGCGTHRYENTSFLRKRLATIAGSRSLIPFYHAAKILPICQYCGVSRAQAKILRQKLDEEEEEKQAETEKKGKKRRRDRDEVALNPSFGANDVNGSMVCPIAVAKAYPDVACPNCRRAMFRCTICHYQSRIDFAMLPKKPIGKKWSTCLRCHHGGHAQHMKYWFTKYDCCPAPGCECNCYRKLKTTDIKEWYTELAEVYGNPDNS